MWANAQHDGRPAIGGIGGAVCSMPQSLLTLTTRVPCSNAAKTTKPVEICRGVANSRTDLSR